MVIWAEVEGKPYSPCLLIVGGRRGSEYVLLHFQRELGVAPLGTPPARPDRLGVGPEEQEEFHKSVCMVLLEGGRAGGIRTELCPPRRVLRGPASLGAGGGRRAHGWRTACFQSPLLCPAGAPAAQAGVYPLLPVPRCQADLQRWS